MRRVVVTGVGTLSPLGDRPEAIHEALAEGRSGVRELSLFATDDLPTRLAAEIAFNPRDYLSGNVRPIDRTGQLSIIAAGLALEAAGVVPEEREVGLVLGTMYGSVKTIAEFDRRAMEAGPKYAKPFDFANSVINAAAGQTAIWHGLRGINSTVAGGAAASLQALAYATDLIRGGRAEVLLAGGAEELSFESFYGFSKAGLLAPGEVPAVPYGASREGFRQGEGAALFLLEEAEAAERRGATVLAEIKGHANSYDPSRGEDTVSSEGAIARALGLALQDAGLAASEVDALAVAANGGQAFDAAEAAGLAAFFGERELPVLAVKGQLGESLGAGPAFQTLALVESMRRGVVPGTAGLEELDPGFPLRGVTSSSREADVRRGVVHAMSFDGNVCALVVERA